MRVYGSRRCGRARLIALVLKTKGPLIGVQGFESLRRLQMIKTCTTCKAEKPLAEFRKDKTKPDGYQYSCKVCKRAYGKDAYSERYSADVKIATKSRYDIARAYVLQYKREHPCVKCGESEVCCLDFHHPDPKEKELTVAKSYNLSFDKLKLEIQKCIVVCRNCHAKIHAAVIPK